MSSRLKKAYELIHGESKDQKKIEVVEKDKDEVPDGIDQMGIPLYGSLTWFIRDLANVIRKCLLNSTFIDTDFIFKIKIDSQELRIVIRITDESQDEMSSMNGHIMHIIIQSKDDDGQFKTICKANRDKLVEIYRFKHLEEQVMLEYYKRRRLNRNPQPMGNSFYYEKKNDYPVDYLRYLRHKGEDW